MDDRSKLVSAGMAGDRTGSQEILNLMMAGAASGRHELPAFSPQAKADPETYDYEVKSWPQFFDPMVRGHKVHDMRNMRDRTYAVGDRMLLREFDPFAGAYTGREAIAYITYITSKVTPCALSSAALDDNFCILSVQVRCLDEDFYA